MSIYTVALFGHRSLSDLKRLEESLVPIIKKLIQIQKESYILFLIGRNGEFDEYVASIIKSLQRECGHDNSELTLVLPYTVANIPYYQAYYDSILIPPCVEGAHPKAATTKKNRWMVEQADLVIVYVEKELGGAYSALRYAEKLSKAVINLAQHAGKSPMKDP